MSMGKCPKTGLKRPLRTSQLLTTKVIINIGRKQFFNIFFNIKVQEIFSRSLFNVSSP